MTTESKQKFIELKNCIKCYVARVDGTEMHGKFFPFISPAYPDICTACPTRGLTRKLGQVVEEWMNNGQQ